MVFEIIFLNTLQQSKIKVVAGMDHFVVRKEVFNGITKVCLVLVLGTRVSISSWVCKPALKDTPCIVSQIRSHQQLILKAFDNSGFQVKRGENPVDLFLINSLARNQFT